MPLDPTALQSELAELFADPPASDVACAAAWADAMASYAAAIVPPSTAVDAAASTLTAALTAAFATPSAVEDFDAAFAAFAAAVGTGMAPAFTATPPPAALNIGLLLAAPVPTHGAAAAGFSALIDTWFRTGTATLVAPPNTVVTWS